MTRWRIWRADAGEADAIAALEAQSFGVRSWGIDNLKASFVAPRVTVLAVGFTPNSPVGFAIWRDLGDEAEILSLGVAPSFRRQGAAGALLREVLADAARAGASAVFLEVDQSNQHAKKLYFSAGFEELSLRRAYYRDGADAVIMRIEL